MPRTRYYAARRRSKLRYRRKWLSRTSATRARSGRMRAKMLIRKRQGRFNYNRQRLEFTGLLANLTATETFGVSPVTLSQGQDFTSFTALYDEYRIRKVRLWVTTTCPEIPPIGTVQGEKKYVVTFNCFQDINDTTAPAAANFLSMGPGRVYRKIVWDGDSNHPARFTYVPTVVMQTSPFPIVKFRPWIPTSSATVAHLGPKWMFRVDEPDVAGIDPTINIDVRYRVEMTVDFKYRQ